MKQRKPGSSQGVIWNVEFPSDCEIPVLIMCIPDYVYGLLPYCGPGSRYEAWQRENKFQDEICRFFQTIGCTTLSLQSVTDDPKPPEDNLLSESCSESVITRVLSDTFQKTGYSLKNTIFLGHGFGVRTLCSIARSGISPAGYILAAGVYSDIESVLTQKYISYIHNNTEYSSYSIDHLDMETRLINSHFGNVLYAIRKRKRKLTIRERDQLIDIQIPVDIHEESNLLFSHLNSPALIIHGSGDLDIPVGNAFYLEQKLIQKITLVTRSILQDCDHWFMKRPADMIRRISERLYNSCSHYPVDERFYQCVALFIWRHLQEKKESSILAKKPDDPYVFVSSVPFHE